MASRKAKRRHMADKKKVAKRERGFALAEVGRRLAVERATKKESRA